MQAHAKVAILSCLINTLLMGTKYGLAMASGSLALRADAIHSLADVVSSLTIFVGIVISDRKTRTFPAGLYKVENLVALFSSFFIFLAAYEIVMEAVSGKSAGQVENLPLVLGGIAFILAVMYVFSRYELRVGLEVGSPSLVADAKHVSTDMLSTLVILVSVAGSYLGYGIDHYVALIVAVLVTRMGFQILVDAVKVLLDATIDQETIQSIRSIVQGHPDVTEVISVGGRSSGRYKFVEVSVALDLTYFRDAHDVIAHLEEEILDQWPRIDRILIHYEPSEKGVEFIAVPLEVDESATPSPDARLSDHFGEASHFAIIERPNSDHASRVREFLENPHRSAEKRKGVLVAEFLDTYDIDRVASRADLEGKGGGYALAAMRIGVTQTHAATLKQFLNELDEQG